MVNITIKVFVFARQKGFFSQYVGLDRKQFLSLRLKNKMIDFITLCDYVGTFAFAISGIRLASAKKFDWFGAYVVGVVTAVGGGTIRDVLLNATPFWMLQLSYLVISGLALLFVLVFRKYVVRLNNTFFIFDAIGLGLFAVVGIAKTLDFGFPMWVASYPVRIGGISFYRTCCSCQVSYQFAGFERGGIMVLSIK